jgi:N-hydroxyarylamine O-acetyltransferase
VPPFDEGSTVSDEFRLQNYLARIGYGGPATADLDTLKALQTAHLAAIPFEGIDPLLRRTVKLDLASVQAKLVDSARGGYCFEHNLLFKTALQAIGFHVTGLVGRPRWIVPAGSPLGPKTHMLLKVDLANVSYLVDVGFGACLLDAPLLLQTNVEQTTALGTYRLTESDRQFTLSAKRQAGWRDLYVFDLQPQIQADYELGNWFTSTSPLVPFTGRLVAERIAGGRRHKLVDRLLSTESRDGEVTSERRLSSAAELAEVLRDVFRIAPPVPPEDIFERTGG